MMMSFITIATLANATTTGVDRDAPPPPPAAAAAAARMVVIIVAMTTPERARSMLYTIF